MKEIVRCRCTKEIFWQMYLGYMGYHCNSVISISYKVDVNYTKSCQILEVLNVFDYNSFDASIKSLYTQYTEENN